MHFERTRKNVLGSELNVVIIHPGDVKSNRLDEDDELIFAIRTYKSLSNEILAPINDFIGKMSLEDQSKLFEFYITAREFLNQEINEENYKEIPNVLGDWFYRLVMNLNLVERLVKYVIEADLPIPDLSMIGKRAQDRTAYTFLHNDYVKLTAISLCCKILGPVFGDLMSKTGDFVNSTDKEVYCYDIISPTLYHPDIVDLNKKFVDYVNNLIDKKIPSVDEEISFIYTHRGYTENRFKKSIYCILLVKRFVNFDVTLREPHICDIMKYVAISTDKQLHNQLRSLVTDKNIIYPRGDVKKNQAEEWGEANSVSALEYESSTSRGTADIPTLVDVITDMTLDRVLKALVIDKDHFDAALKFHKYSPIMPSVFNKALVSTLIGNMIGGAYGLQYMNIEAYSRLVVATQLYASKVYQNQLVHLLTCSTNQYPKITQISSTDQRIMFNSDNSTEYRKLTSMIPYNINNKSINTQLLALREWIIMYDHFYNTAPVVSELNGDVIENNVRIDYEDIIMREVCAFFVDAVAKYT
jgi:hypothetical protein